MTKISLQLLIVFLGLNTLAFSQCCPYINSVEVLPQNPDGSDEISIATFIATPGNGAFLQHQFHWENDTLVVEACYYSGLLTVVTEIYDTVPIGTVPAGDYVLQFIASISSDEDSCVANDSQTFFSSFSVNAAVGLDANKQLLSKLYPNPAKEFVMLTSVSEKPMVQVFAFTGQQVEIPMIHAGNELLLDIHSLAAGIYEVVEYSGEAVPNRYRFVKED